MLTNKPFQPGELISAKEFTELKRMAIRNFAGFNVYQDATGSYVAAPLTEGGITAAGVNFAKITAKAGTSPPFIYSGLHVEHDGVGFTPSDFTELEEGAIDLGWLLINIQEIGDSGAGVRSLAVGSIVTFWPLPNSTYYGCTASHYRGTY